MTLGFVGLGVMGGRIAARLLSKGYSVVGFDRVAAKGPPLVSQGLTWVDSPRAVAASAAAIFVMVPDSAALEAAAAGPDGLLAGLGPGKVLIDMSTVSPAVSQAVAAQARERGAEMVDAPVSGSVSAVEGGTLAVMVGGDRATFDRISSVLRELGPTVSHVGGNGMALAVKIAINLSVAVQMLAFSEGVLLAEKSGIDRKTAVELMTNSVIASPLVKYKAPFVLQLPDQAWFNVTMMQKDVGLALEAGRRLGVPLPTTAATNEMLTAARAAGLGDEDFAAMFHVLARMSGVGE
jgi:3-hydroxyisobutyrate dehydrogenase-like beta-hydroxyacid dehydrogenase